MSTNLMVDGYNDLIEVDNKLYGKPKAFTLEIPEREIGFFTALGKVGIYKVRELSIFKKDKTVHDIYSLLISVTIIIFSVLVLFFTSGYIFSFLPIEATMVGIPLSIVMVVAVISFFYGFRRYISSWEV
jgi:hypothetical protein